MKKHAIGYALIISLLLPALAPTPGRADIYHFFNLTHNGPDDLSGQLTVNVTQPSAEQVSFLFQNAVGIPSSVCDVYFYNGSYISGTPTQSQSTGVSFSGPAKPGHLPGYDTTGVVYSADSDSPNVPANGINKSPESLQYVFNLYSGRTFASLLEGLRDGDFAIGFHVQSIGTSGYSDSYITTPIPGAVLLGLLGLGAAGLKLRRLV
jgi:hypothetical protein